jgi:hypothetical protein
VLSCICNHLIFSFPSYINQTLSSNEELENSIFSVNNKMRSRLLQRIHLAYLRQVQEARASTSSEESGSNHLLTSTSTSEGGKDGRSCQDASGDAILTATSIRMSLAILQCLGPASECIYAILFCSVLLCSALLCPALCVHCSFHTLTLDNHYPLFSSPLLSSSL